MKSIFVIIILVIIFNISDKDKNCNVSNKEGVFKSLEVYYLDSITNPALRKWRELKYIGEEPYFSKPQAFDVYIKLNDNSLDGEIEVMIEEYFVKPDTQIVAKLRDYSFNKDNKYWSLHKVIGHYSYKNKIMRKIEIGNVKYQTAYYIDSKLYPKNRFRISAWYFDRKTGKIESIKKEFNLLIDD